MPDEREFEALKGRIVELENQLKQVSGGQQPAADITAEDLQAYVKVQDVVGKYGPVLQCMICWPCHCLKCYPCINECICGPCNICGAGGLGNVGGGRFGGLGF